VPLPNNNDSTIARQADRSGYPRTAVLTFPAELLVAGENLITFAHGSPAPAGKGPGWDTLVLEVDEGAPAEPARLAVSLVKTYAGAGTTTWEVPSGPAQIIGRDPKSFAVPLAAVLPPAASTVTHITVVGGQPVSVTVTADGGRTITTTSGR
jgi:rhamnogalacturonan endolyase